MNSAEMYMCRSFTYSPCGPYLPLLPSTDSCFGGRRAVTGPSTHTERSQGLTENDDYESHKDIPSFQVCLEGLTLLSLPKTFILPHFWQRFGHFYQYGATMLIRHRMALLEQEWKHRTQEKKLSIRN